MEICLQDYLGRKRDTQRERELASRLRELPEPVRFTYIQEILQGDMVIGLQIASACLSSKSYFVDLLKQGLQVADASSIRLWLEMVLPRLGPGRVIGILTQSIEEMPDAVEKALYWLPQLMSPEEARSYAKLLELHNKMSIKETERRSDIEPISATL